MKIVEEESIGKRDEESAENSTVTEETALSPDLIKCICNDDFQEFIAVYRGMNADRDSDLSETERRCEAVRYLHFACRIDAVSCVKSILDGDLGFRVPVNSRDENGKTSLHHAAFGNSENCAELLLKKYARADIKAQDGALPLDICLNLKRIQIEESFSDSVIELLWLIKNKDMKIVRLLASNTKDLAQLAYKKATDGDIVAFAIILSISSNTVLSASIACQENPSLHASVFNHILSKVLSRKETEKHLVYALELLLHLGAKAFVSKASDQRTTDSPLIDATKAGDSLVLKLLLRAKFNPNDSDRFGNTALHYSLRVSAHEQDISTLSLLLMHGASTFIKNALGSTPVHTAACYGHLQGLQMLLFQDPEHVDALTETLETPLFYAAKNNHLNCAKLLLHYGADPKALNLRKQRPVDVARSQEMRDLLNSLDYGIKQILYKSNPTQDQIVESLSLGMLKNSEYCKESPGGFNRGDKCYYAHRGGKLVAEDLGKKVFVGGLPLSVDSEDLRALFQNKFGSVVDAIVIGGHGQLGDQIHSRGFGFVTFNNEETVALAVKAHYLTIYGKQVEIKGAVPKSYFYRTESGGKETTEGDTVLQEKGQFLPRNLLNSGQNPLWVEKFKIWLPEFLWQASKWLMDGEWYPLSSLKGDFRATCGLELDHISLGYLKLSDFIKSMPGLCRVKIVPVGHGPATHMVLQAFPRRRCEEQVTIIADKSSLVDKGRSFADAAAAFKEPKAVSKPVFSTESSNPAQENGILSGSSRIVQRPKTVHPQQSVHYLDELLSAFDVSVDKASGGTETVQRSAVHSDASVCQPDPSLNTPVPHNFLGFLERDKSFFTPWANVRPMYKEVRVQPLWKQALCNIIKESFQSPKSVLSTMALQSSASSGSNNSVDSGSSSDIAESGRNPTNAPKCQYCMQRKATWFAVPCTHKILCTLCRNAKLAQMPFECSVCGQQVTKFIALP